jgi:tetratricopeptide (TPR) repeat protein
MRSRLLLLLSLSVLLAFLFLLEAPAPAQEGKGPDKALCAKMLQFGKEAYLRGRYLDAKEYFRKAIQADPSNNTAWQLYDQAAIFALAERVEKDSRLIMPDASVRHEAPAAPALQPPPAPPATPPAPPSSAPPKKDPEFKIIQDEGC